MSESQPEILTEFQEFLEAKRQAEKDAETSEDFELEIFDEKGRGVRTRRSHAKPFLQQLGIDLDPEPNPSDKSGDGDAGDKGKGGDKSKGTKRNATGSQSVTRKYFTKAAVKP